jgi:glutamine amidotransferase
MSRIAIVDYGMGNLRSVEKALTYVAAGRYDVQVTRHPDEVRAAERVVFPGQGAIRDCMAQIRGHGLEESLREAVRDKPFLGICIGLQSLMERSDEDLDTEGLGIYAGKCVRFPDGARDPVTGARLKIPHMGWNQVKITKAHALWDGIDDLSRFYFVHSYHVEPGDPSLVAATSDYPGPFACALAHDNTFAVQFHPEKSQHSGLRLLTNFLRWQP